MNSLKRSGPQLVDRIASANIRPGFQHIPEVQKLLLEISDEVTVLDSGRALLILGEHAASKLPLIDFAVLSSVFRRCRDLFGMMSPSELVGLLSLAARLDFVDSDLNEAIQNTLPSLLSTFSDNHFPILFCSVLRLGADQPIDRVPAAVDEEPCTTPASSPLLEAIVGETIPRIGSISESGSLAILHAILRRPKTKITPEMDRLVRAISEKADISNWSLGMRIQAIHSLSRFGAANDDLIRALLDSIDAVTITRVPSGNLQHLLSIIHNHAEKHPESIWRPVLEQAVERMGEPNIARSMSMATVSVTIGYMGRLNVRDERVLNTLLNVLYGFKPKTKVAIRDTTNEKLVENLVNRVLTDNQTDIAHLTSIMEAIQRLDMWDLPLAVPLAMVTRRLIFRDGIHNIKAAPLCLATNVFIHNTFGLSDAQVHAIDVRIDGVINEILNENRMSSNWCMKSNSELMTVSPDLDWRDQTILTLLEGLLKHEQYIRSTSSAVKRCIGLRDSLKSSSVTIHWDQVPDKVRHFIDSLEDLDS